MLGRQSEFPYAPLGAYFRGQHNLAHVQYFPRRADGERGICAILGVKIIIILEISLPLIFLGCVAKIAPSVRLGRPA